MQDALARANLTLEALYLSVEGNEALDALVELLMDLNECESVVDDLRCTRSSR